MNVICRVRLYQYKIKYNTEFIWFKTGEEDEVCFEIYLVNLSVKYVSKKYCTLTKFRMLLVSTEKGVVKNLSLYLIFVLKVENRTVGRG